MDHHQVGENVYEPFQDYTFSYLSQIGVADLENYSSDADSDVLADYVIALVRDDDPEPQLRQNVMGNLEDFLKDSTCLDPEIRLFNLGVFFILINLCASPQTPLPSLTSYSPQCISSPTSQVTLLCSQSPLLLHRSHNLRAP